MSPPPLSVVIKWKAAGLSHPVCVCGAVDWRDSSVRNTTASSTVTLHRAGGEHQVDSFFINSSSSSASSTSISSTLPRSSLALTQLVLVVLVLRLQLKAQGGVDGDDATAGRNAVSDVGDVIAFFPEL